MSNPDMTITPENTQQKTRLPWPLLVGGLFVGLHLVIALLSLVWTPYGVDE